MLRVDQLTVHAGEQHLLGPIDFNVSAGQALVIMGESGAGKSLIAQAVMGNLPKSLRSSAQISLSDTRIDLLSPTDRQLLWGRKIALLPQEPWLALDPLMRSGRQVRETHRLVGDRSIRDAAQRTVNDFQALGLTGAEQQRPDQLSGGMCQRVAFAAALAGGAAVMLADEPTKGLDRERANRIIESLMQTCENGGALIVITHDIAVTRAIGGYTLVLKDGVCVEQGNTNDVLRTPNHDYTQALIAADPGNWSTSTKTTSDDPLLHALDLTVGHGSATLVENLDLTLNRDERLAITGPSGIGKTTLLDTLAGLIPPLDGVVIRDQSIGTTGIQKIYQDPPAAFAKHVSLATSLKDVARLHGIDWDQINRLLESLNINPDMLSRLPSQISGGELQRIAIARALAVKPTILLADEPTSRLDPLTQRMTMELLEKVSAESNIAVILVTHDDQIASRWATRSLCLDKHVQQVERFV